MDVAASFPSAQRRPATASELASLGRKLFLGSVLFLVFGTFTSLGGWEWLLSLSSTSTGCPSHQTTLSRAQAIARSAEEPSFIQWPLSLFYLVPLAVPLTLYIVIARWTGEQYFKFS